MTESLHDLQAASGATFTPIATLEVPVSFGNDTAALHAAHEQVAVYDRSHWGRIQVTGADRIRFLHNQSTNNFQVLQPGQGCDTVFVTSTARTIDLVTAYILEDSVLLLTSPGYSQKLMQWMDRYIFFADKVNLKDITQTTATFSLVGATADTVLHQLGLEEIIDQPRNSHQTLTIGRINVRIAVGSGLALPGYTLITDMDQAGMLWQTLTEQGVVPLGEQAWQQLRVQQGRPEPDRELTDDYNPLEAGLWHTISLSKGCYIGQETIARLHTYKGVKQQLWGIRLSQFAALETVVMAGEEKVGTLTSCIQTETGYFGLAYIRSKAVTPGLQVTVGASAGELVSLPFLSHDYP